MRHNRRFIAVATCLAAALLCALADASHAQVRRAGQRPGAAPQQRPQAAGQLRLGRFVGRSPAAPRNQAVQPGAPPRYLSAAELKAALPLVAAVGPYADLSAHSPSAANRAYLSFELYGTRSNNMMLVNYVDGNHVYFKDPGGHFKLVIKPRAAGKTYVADCTVKLNSYGSGDFTASSMDGHKEIWRGEKEWQHLVFAVIPEDTGSYQVMVSNDGPDWAFGGCRVMEY